MAVYKSKCEKRDDVQSSLSEKQREVSARYDRIQDKTSEMMDPCISIIVPFYNAEAYLDEMLHSISKQTYDHYEVLLINDGSTDGSEVIAKRHTSHDPRFRCAFQQNQGVSAARNYGLSLAQGNWIAFLDADDIIPPNYFATLVSKSSGADIVVCNVRIVKNGKDRYVFSHGEKTLNATEAMNALLTRKTINSGPNAKLFSRASVSDLKFPAMKTYEDILFVMRAFEHAHTVVSTDATEYVYVQNENGAMGAMLRDPSLDIVKATETIMDYIIAHNELDPDCCYTTLSHLYQYAYPIALKTKTSPFVAAARTVYQKYLRQIVSCKAFPWKEKVLFYLFAQGFVIRGRRIFRMVYYS